MGFNIAEKLLENKMLVTKFVGGLNEQNVMGHILKEEIKVIKLSTNSMPKEAFQFFLGLATRISMEFGQSKFNKMYYIEDIPFIGTVIRMAVLSEEKIREFNIDFSSISDLKEFKSAIAKTLILSVFYDDKSVLSVVNKPYFEMFNFIGEPERFFVDEKYEFRDKGIALIRERLEKKVEAND